MSKREPVNEADERLRQSVDTAVTPEGIARSSQHRPKRRRRPAKMKLQPWMYKHDAHAPMHVLCDATLSRNARLIFTMLCGHAWGTSDEAFPAQRTLATYLDLSVRWTRDALDELCARGLIAKEEHRQDDKRGSRLKGKAGLTYRLLHKAKKPK